jgi:hypothetical protein
LPNGKECVVCKAAPGSPSGDPGYEAENVVAWYWTRGLSLSLEPTYLCRTAAATRD